MAIYAYIYIYVWPNLYVYIHIYIAHDRVHWGTFVNTVMKLRFRYTTLKSLTNYPTSHKGLCPVESVGTVQILQHYQHVKTKLPLFPVWNILKNRKVCLEFFLQNKADQQAAQNASSFTSTNTSFTQVYRIFRHRLWRCFIVYPNSTKESHITQQVLHDNHA